MQPLLEVAAASEHQGVGVNGMQSGSYDDEMLQILRTDLDYIDPHATSAYFESASWPEDELLSQPLGSDASAP